MNTWKHHAGALRQRIAATSRAGAAALEELAENLVVIGTELMDLYTGAFTPAELGQKILALLRLQDQLALEPYRRWIEEGGGYQTLTLTEDGSSWTLRLGEEAGRYIHLHPCRWVAQTRRVRANVLKTAVMVLAYAGVHGGDPYQVKLVNAVRRQYLELAPVKELTGDQGLSVVLDLLRSPK
jgi:hypothetical protein